MRRGMTKAERWLWLSTLALPTLWALAILLFVLRIL